MTDLITNTQPLDCACVIHSNGYDWTYVDRLYNMLCRHLTRPVRLHIYTEAARPVPDHMVKHCLEDWGFAGPKKSWWYKLQLFNTQHHSGPMLYFDLDCVIVNDLTWITQLDSTMFWGIKDFKYLQQHVSIVNSSVMWFNTREFAWLWQRFSDQGIDVARQGCQGDQDYITKNIDPSQRRFFDTKYFQSYRWQCLDGGYDFKYRRYHKPGTGVTIAPDTAVVVFHGSPNPHQVSDPTIAALWR